MLDNLPLFAQTGLDDGLLWGLIIASYFTSALTAAFGIGGGIALLAILSLALPVATLIPVHGMVQLGSNFGRAWHLRTFIEWPFMLAFGIGAIIGTGLGSQIVVSLPDALLKIILACFVLTLVWGPRPKSLTGGHVIVGIGGFLSSLASMFVGATGPLTASIVAGRSLDRQGIVSTHASAMTLQHGLKILAFGFIGFSFKDWIGLIAAMILTGYLGTITGANILRKLDENLFQTIFKLLLTALALLLLIRALSQQV